MSGPDPKTINAILIALGYDPLRDWSDQQETWYLSHGRVYCPHGNESYLQECDLAWEVRSFKADKQMFEEYPEAHDVPRVTHMACYCEECVSATEGRGGVNFILPPHIPAKYEGLDD